MPEALAIDRPFAGLLATAARLKSRAGMLSRRHPREAVGLGVLAFISSVALGSAMVQTPVAPASQTVAPPAPPPLLLKQIAPDQALKVNADIPLAGGPNPAAAPFAFKGSSGARAQALQCLASAVYYEAGNQDEDGARAVAQVVLNRVRHPAFPATVCGVVYQGSTRPTGCQFTFTCDGSLARTPAAEAWRRAYKIAQDALSGTVFAPVGWATHYHADYVVPYWASSMAKNAIVGAHIFYRWAGGWGQPAVFNKVYAGREPDAAALRTAALAVPHVVQSEAQEEVAEAVSNIPGAEPLKLDPSLRGDKKVGVRFNLVAREASNKAVHEVYEKKFGASENLKWSLSSNTSASDQEPLGATASSKTNAPAPASLVGAAER
jgi:spore germination cell wall hydrolase CwlJ-like protein